MSVADNPFHSQRWPRTVVLPGEHEGGDALSLSWDTGRLTEAEKKRTIHAWIDALPGLTQLKRLQLWCQVTPPVFEAVCTLPQLQVLHLKWSNLKDLQPITRLPALQALRIGSSTRVASIEPLARLQALVWLDLENFKAITDFSPLTRLTALRHLAVTGSLWSRQAIASLAPFAAMTWLHTLALDTASVTSLKPLASLTGLHTLDLGGRLPYEEYAWLAARLPHTQCRWFAPWLDLADSGIGRCKACGQQALVMVTGKGKPTLCRHCDADKLARHVALFEAARQAA